VPGASAPDEAWQRHYKRTIRKRSRARRLWRGSVARLVHRRRRVLVLALAIGALYAAALGAAFIL
jgi:hypothetical protein